jgi:multiple sugar transport system ATP-binding protein
MSTLKLVNINKVYPNNVQVVFDFNLEIADGEFVVFVGPSGCGKSTTLRMVAGLEDITSGEFYIDGQLMNDVAPGDRNIAMVFQSYALYPHMSVFENIAFSLRLKKVAKDIINEKVLAVAKKLDIEQYLQRKPKALSGGQRQRVAVARAIVRDSKVLLFDEPLSNLDAKLRIAMRAELIKLHSQLKTTTIYVTHDQIEAMTMASRIVVMKGGYIQQIGSPKEIYDNPVNLFVAGFIGTPPMNFIEGSVNAEGYFVNSQIKVKLPATKASVIKNAGYIDKPLVLGIRPEDIHDEEIFFETYPQGAVDVTMGVVELLGNEYNLYFDIEGANVCAKVRARQSYQIGKPAKLVFDLAKVYFFDKESTNRIQ